MYYTGGVSPAARSASLLIAVALASLALAGCVRREIEVTSTPPGALLTLNGREIGRTPVRVQFTFDGTYDVRLRLAGYESVQGSGKTDAPVWDFAGADLVAEVVPGQFRRLERWHFQLVPEAHAEVGLMDRAQAARRSVESMPATAPDAPAPAPATTATPEERR